MEKRKSNIIPNATRHMLAIQASWVVLKCCHALQMSWVLTLAPLILTAGAKALALTGAIIIYKLQGRRGK